MKKYLIYITGAFAVLLLTSCQKEETDEAYLAEVARIINSKVPTKVDQYATLDSAVVGKGLSLTYYYTIAGIEEAGLDIDVNLAKASLKEQSQMAVDTTEGMKLFKHQVTLYYRYNDTDGAPMFDYTVKTKTKQK